MNSGPNSDSKQCSESKLGLVHSAHTHALGCTRTASRPRAQRRVVVSTGSYHEPLPGRIAPVPGCVVAVPCRVDARTRALARRVAVSGPAVLQPPRRDIENRVTIQLLSHALSFVSQRPCTMSQGAAAPYRSLYRHDTIFCILTHPWLGHVRARCRTPRAQAGRVVGRVVHVAGCIAALLRPSMHPFGRIVAWCPNCVMIQYAVS